VRKRFKRARELSQGSVGLTRYPWTRLKRDQLRTDLSRLRHDLARVVCLGRRLQRLEVLGGLSAHRGIRAGSRRGRARWGGRRRARALTGGRGRGRRGLGLRRAAARRDRHDHRERQ